MNTTKNIDFSTVTRLFEYSDYVKMLIELFAQNKVTGNEQGEVQLNATEINLQRIKRINKTGVIADELQQELKNLKRKITWYVLSEGWCGDSAQNLPFLAKMADLSQNVELRIVLRDDNPEMMNAFLSNDARSVPKLICVDTTTGDYIDEWGARPAAIQQKVLELKKDNPNIGHDELVQNIHLWYGKDRGKALNAEFTELIKKWNN